MNETRRTVLRGLGGGATLVALAGCIDDSQGSGADDGDGSAADAEDAADAVTLLHGRTGEEAEVLETTARTFNADHEGGRVRLAEAAEIEAAIETVMPTGEGPELYEWHHDWIGDHAEAGFLYDASGDLTIDLEETFVDPAVEAVTWDGAVYGLPVDGETVSLYYNRDLVDDPPSTVDELESVMAAHHDPSRGEYGIAVPPDPYFLSFLTHAFGGYYFDDTAGLGLRLPETIEGMELVRDVIWPYAPDDMEHGVQTTAFADGNAPFTITGPWDLDSFVDDGIDVGVAPLPDIDGGTPTPYAGVRTCFLSERNELDADRRETAVAFAEALTTSEAHASQLAESSNAVPILRDLHGAPDLSDPVRAFQDTFEHSIPIPASRRMDSVWVPTENAIQSVLVDDIDVETAFEEAAEEIEANWD